MPPSSDSNPSAIAGLTRRSLLTAVAATSVPLASCRSGYGRTAVLTFDDAVRSHRHFVAPLLKELGFSATFFVTHRWMDDRENFMTWREIAEISELGFEIGNHSWSHADFSVPKNAARLAGELALVENELAKVGVDKPTSFAWCGNRFGPEAVQKLGELGIRLARRGLSPELDNRSLEAGPAYHPRVHDRLLIPTTGNAVPDWSMDSFLSMLDRAGEGIVVLQFHGVPDDAHPWVHTPPNQFRAYMEVLAERGFEVLALRDLERRVPLAEVNDPNIDKRNPSGADRNLPQPVEFVQTRSDLSRWTEVMARHAYSVQEATDIAGFSNSEAAAYAASLASGGATEPEGLAVDPYPGGRHPRTGFLDGAIDPLRGTKASVFLPWDQQAYVVVDLPELITSQIGHLFLAHTHVPTIWNEQNVWLDNVDWISSDAGGLELEWTLPNGVSFGSSLRPEGDSVAMALWLHNGLAQPLRGLRTQLCVMLKGASGFNAQTQANKVFDPPVAAVRSADDNRWILTAWERSGRCWGNTRCPCMHSDPVFPDCAAGATVRLRGRLWCYEGDSITAEVDKARREFPALAAGQSGV